MTVQTLVNSIPHLIAMALLIALSGAISASETAIFALNRHQLARLRQSPHAFAQLVLRLREDPRGLLSTILLSNITVNTLLYSTLAVVAVRLAGGSSFWSSVFGAVGFVIILTGGEIGPKLIALGTCQRLAPMIALPVRLLEVVTLPVRWLLEISIVEPLTRIIAGPGPRPTHHVHRDIHTGDLQRLVRLTHMQGLIDRLEDAFLQRVMNLTEMRVTALMIPRVDLVAFNLADERGKLSELIKSSRLLRIPVYEGHIDNVKGMIHAKEFLLNPQTPPRELIRPIRFIPEQANVESLLQHFRSSGSKSALVVDEYGGLAGIVALEDVVEVIIGELYAPGEVSVPHGVHRVNDTTYLVDAGLQLDEFCRAFNLSVEETRVNTVGGLIAQTLDRIAKRGDQISIGGATLAVVAMKDRRIIRVRLSLEKPPPQTPDLLMLEQNLPPDSSDDSSSDWGVVA